MLLALTAFGVGYFVYDSMYPKGTFSTSKNSSKYYQDVENDISTIMDYYTDNVSRMEINPSLLSRNAQYLEGGNNMNIVRAVQGHEGQVGVELQKQAIKRSLEIGERAFQGYNPLGPRVILPNQQVKPLFVNLTCPEQDPVMAKNYPFVWYSKWTPDVPIQNTDIAYYNKATDILNNGGLDRVLDAPASKFTVDTPYGKEVLFRGLENRQGGGFIDNLYIGDTNEEKNKHVQFAQYF